MTLYVSDVIDDISSTLHSYTGMREMMTTLTTATTPDDLIMYVADSAMVTIGQVEVGDELVTVDSVDDTGLSIPPWGRRMENQGFSDGNHSAGSRVVNDPLVPKVNIFRAVKDTVRMTSPDLFTTQVVTLAWQSRGVYNLPAGADRVLSVRQTTAYAPPVRVTDWTFQPSEGGVLPALICWVNPGQSLKATVAMPLTEPSAKTDAVAPLGWERFADVIKWGACWQLIQAMEPGRLANQSIIQSSNSETVPYGSATKTAQQFYAMYNQRKQDERKALLMRHDAQSHWSA